MNNTIAIYNFKGGVGKTTSAFNLACGWSRKYKVLVIDCDPQCNLSNALILNCKSKYNVYAYLKGFVHNSIPTIKPIKVNGRLDLIPGHYNMIELESNSQFIEFGSVILQRLLERVKMNYDIVLIDCPSYFGKTVKAVLNSSDNLLIPATPDVFSLKGAVKLLRYIKEMERTKPINVLGIFLNRFRRNFLYHRKMVLVAKRIFGSFLITKTVRNAVQINETSDRRFVRNSGDPHSNIASDFLALCDLVVEKLDSKEVKRFPLSSVEKTRLQASSLSGASAVR